MARMSWRVRRGRLKLNMVACRVYRGREIVACRYVGVGMWGIVLLIVV